MKLLIFCLIVQSLLVRFYFNIIVFIVSLDGVTLICPQQCNTSTLTARCEVSSNVMHCQNPPNPPANVTVTNITESSIGLEWSPPASLSTAPITGYINNVSYANGTSFNCPVNQCNLTTGDTNKTLNHISNLSFTAISYEELDISISPGIIAIYFYYFINNTDNRLCQWSITPAMQAHPS